MFIQNIKDSGLLKIGELAQKAGESVATIRFWTYQGFLPVKAYSKGGYQLYHPSMVGKAKKIRQFPKETKLAPKPKISTPAKKLPVVEKIKDTGLWRISELAREAGEAISTIRFWTDEGLLSVKAFSKGGYQLYDSGMVEKAKLIRKLQQEKRMTVKEIKEYMNKGLNE